MLKFEICLRINKIMLSRAPVPLVGIFMYLVDIFMYWFMTIFKGMRPSKK